jgi:hypothetical protein
VRTSRRNAFDELFSDPVIVVSSQPLTAEQASDEGQLLARAARGELVAMAVRFDGRPKRGRLFNVAVFHEGLEEPALLPDVVFQYAAKGAIGILSIEQLEFRGHRYAGRVEFPAPAETTETRVETEAARPLPPPSRTDADRQAATRLLIDALREGDETRALEIVKLGIDPNGRDEKTGIAVVNWAVIMCQPLVVKALVELKADVRIERLPGMTLMTEAMAACPEAVPFLRAAGAP